MEKINYAKLLDDELEIISKLPERPQLLLHCCCAPCSSAVLERIARYFKITALFYNPNIFPESEFMRRNGELQRLLGIPELIDGAELVTPEYDHDEFLDAVRGLEDEREGGVRCERCFRLRMEEAATAALGREADYFTTTLSISPHKDARLINRIGAELAEKYGVKYLFADFKKRDGYRRSIELCRLYGVYRQNYCGCEFNPHAADRAEASCD